MAFTARIPDALQTEAETYAATLGISLNALLAVALRHYLDDRAGRALVPSQVVLPTTAVPRPLPGPEPRSPKGSVLLSDDTDLAVPRSVSRAPCWCGSGKQLRHCHKVPKK